MKKQQYIVISHGDSRMGASPNIHFCTKKQLTGFNLFAEYLDIYSVEQRLSDKQKKDLGLEFSPYFKVK